MAELQIERPAWAAGNVRVVTVDEAIVEAREQLDEFERRYGVPSGRMGEAFADESGLVVETGAYLRWRATLDRWRQLSGAGGGR